MVKEDECCSTNIQHKLQIIMFYSSSTSPKVATLVMLLQILVNITCSAARQPGLEGNIHLMITLEVRGGEEETLQETGL